MTEVADLIEQVRDHDPAQAQELFDKTMQGIDNGERRSLEEHSRTLEFHPDKDRPRFENKLGRQDDDKSGAMMPMGAKDDAANGQDTPRSNAGTGSGDKQPNEEGSDDIWSVEDKPMTDGGAKHVQPGNAERSPNHEEKGKKDPSKIEWNEKPIFQQNKGSNELKTKGPVRIRAQSVTLGTDDIDYELDWLPLDKDGNVVPVWRNNDHKVEKNEIGVFMGQSKPSKHQPPFDNPNGFMVKVRIPP